METDINTSWKGMISGTFLSLSTDINWLCIKCPTSYMQTSQVLECGLWSQLEQTTATFVPSNSLWLPSSVWVLWTVHGTLWKDKNTPWCWDITGFCREIGFKLIVLGKDLVNWEKHEAFMNTNCFRAQKCEAEIGVLLWQRGVIELPGT